MPTKLEIESEICRQSYYEFFKRAWHVLEPENPFEDNWHIEYICNILQAESERIAKREPKTSDIIINIPPRTLKSMLVTVMWNAWTWISYPKVSFITASYSGELSTEHAIKTRRLIESDWYQERFWKKSSNPMQQIRMAPDQNAKSKFENQKRGSRRSTSVGGTITGGGADIVICDDPLKAQEAYSETARKTAIDWWTKTMFSRLNDQRIGLRVVVMQRLHEEDLTGYLLAKKLNYRLIRLPAELTDDVTPEELRSKYVDGLLSPVRFNKEVLSEAKTTLGSLDYPGQYLQTPNPADGDILKEKWFRGFKASDVPGGLVRRYYTDSAYGKEGSDNSSTICYSVYNKDLYIWGVYAWNLPFPQFIEKYKAMLGETGYTGESKCYFEPKASGISIVQQLRNDGGINVIEDKPPSDSKTTRIVASSASIEAGRVHILDGCEGAGQLISEAVAFPNGKFDDCIDALASIIRIEMLDEQAASIDVF